jgi:hypothetical protein
MVTPEQHGRGGKTEQPQAGNSNGIRKEMKIKTAYPDLQEEQTDINLTSMLDIVFILLVFLS